ncbi:MAG: hypothetical protein L0G09_15145 [Acinetobacter sp.]|nr:hypothetical protein [Acinetobacter sp.]MDN5647662.1 hypothetical protein [Acinetobacter sp.]
MAIQTINLGTAPSGAGGDTFRSTGTKVNENFTNNTHSASRLVGTAAGNVMEVGALGLGSGPRGITIAENINNTDVVALGYDEGRLYPSGFVWKQVDRYLGALLGMDGEMYAYCRLNSNTNNPTIYKMRSTKNTTVDSNGFIKAASPVVQLFADKIAANEEALEQEPIFEKVDVGHYLIKNTEGFSDDGWYIEMPKDANGNVLVAVQYQQLEENTIEVKTFAKKFDEETGDIVPNLEKPRDIPAGRWIDIRLKELPKPDIEISNTPPEFQPTNLEQAVSEALKNDSEQ